MHVVIEDENAMLAPGHLIKTAAEEGHSLAEIMLARIHKGGDMARLRIDPVDPGLPIEITRAFPDCSVMHLKPFSEAWRVTTDFLFHPEGQRLGNGAAWRRQGPGG